MNNTATKMNSHTYKPPAKETGNKKKYGGPLPPIEKDKLI
jgi:hypothetical protein